jgi:hypothetical protein
VADTESVPGDRTLDRARKLVALDRALIEIGEPGVLERAPEDVASLEARLFGSPPASGADAAADGTGSGHAPATGGKSAAARAGAAPALRVVAGALKTRPEVDQATRQALRAQLKLIPGGRRAV